MYKERIKLFRQKFNFWGIDYFLITKQSDIFYLTGFHGEDSCLLVSKYKISIYTDGRYITEVKQLGLNCVQTNQKFKDIKKIVFKNHKSVLAYDGDMLNVSDYLGLKDGIKDNRLKNLNEPLLHLRVIKNAQEIKLIKKAIKIAETAFLETSKIFKIGLTETQIAAELEYNMRKLGANSPSFSTIAAIGSNAALPHANPTNRKISKNSLLLMDFGARYQGYDSDQTRMIVFGKLSALQTKVLDIVQQAQNTAIKIMAPDVCCSDVDKVARDIIEKANYGDFFNHSTGHGVGIDIHEQPSLSSRSKTVLKEGMIVTVEPGIYLASKFGVRLEEMVQITKTGAKRLTSLPMIMHYDI